jgi:NAD(P)H-dependent FMN reductase
MLIGFGKLRNGSTTNASLQYIAEQIPESGIEHTSCSSTPKKDKSMLK